MPDHQLDQFGPWSFEEERIVGKPDAQALAAGQKLWTSRAVTITSLTIDEAAVEVWDVEGNWLVNVWLSNGLTYFECTCAEGRNYARNICKHKVAAAIELAGQFPEEASTDWHATINDLIDARPIRKSVANQVIAFSVTPWRGRWSVAPVSIPVDTLDGIDPGDRDGIRDLMHRQRLDKRARFYPNTNDASVYVNTTDASATVCRMLAIADTLKHTSQSRRGPSLGDILPLLRHCLTFLGGGHGVLTDVLTVLDKPVAAGIRVEKSVDGLHLYPNLITADGSSPEIARYEPIWDQPTWLIGGSTLFELQKPSPAVAKLMATAPDYITIPSDGVEKFYSDFLPRLSEQAPVELRSVNWVDVDVDPTGHLYLTEVPVAGPKNDHQTELRIRLRYVYGEHEVSDIMPGDAVSIVKAAGGQETDTFIRIRRKPNAEQTLWSNLLQHGLKTGGDNNTFALRARVTPLDFLIHHVPRLLEAGFEVYGQDELKSIRVNRNKPSLRLTVSSGIDWFDLDAAATFGDIDLPLASLYDAIKKREKFVKLADGSIGAIPPEWIERYRHLFALAEKKGDSLRVAARQQILIEDALAQADQADVDAEFAERRERLRTFDSIDNHRTLPAGFVGELRPYQKAGFDWLHFLHDYEFGGILADDMGIGKTVQTLTFLLSLKENGEATGSNLIVMPRSLLFNWEREASKFTPGLKVLVHSDNRTKVARHFERYDLVLTTYGVLLRDIEMLRKHKFHYAILDESQAIKNPLSQTGRAARLLNADHRLTLTGTPVENSTIELWSQFAFVNPGMLGGLDYFRDEFAAAIEKGNDPESAKLLRKMVHPFILRRTKDQVAPELPPRTERILYAEMEPEQQAFYDKTKAEYKAELLGVIENLGMNNARMRILEALLRLRQIANHPKLVDPTSKAGSSKFDLLIETLSTVTSENHKALVFSQFVSMLSLVRTELDKTQIAYSYLDGRTRNRQEKVDEFQNRSDLPLFLISLKAGGVGLNLTAADYVIHIDPWWNPAVERQATDRTHRIGQDKPVFVYKLITRGTVEEKILELQDKKRALADTLISTEEGFFKSLTAQDVAELLG